MNILDYINAHNDAQRRVTDELSDVELDQDWATHICELTINGRRGLEAQVAVVKCLRINQKLVIPSHLASGLIADGQVAPHKTIVHRVMAAHASGYAKLRLCFETKMSRQEIRNAMDDMVDPPPPAEGKWNYEDWLTDVWFEEDTTIRDDPQARNVVMACISYALQINCDMRDIGALRSPDMRLCDTEWITTLNKNDALTKLAVKLQTTTMQIIAGLNYEAVGKNAMAAWIRAYGVACGFLPAITSMTQQEYYFIALNPPAASMRAVVKAHQNFEESAYMLALNVIAMFGIFHLNKDHTYKEGDAHMNLICKSYIETMRTGVPDGFINEMYDQAETYCRTAVQPFGLTQSYYVARALYSADGMFSPLKWRVFSAPPSVQRLMICDACACEWNGLPIGKKVSELYHQELFAIRAQIAEIKKCPPAFSSLARLYGYDQPITLDQTLLDAVESMLPCVTGYVMAYHHDDRAGYDGVGLALSLQNIKRAHKTVVPTWRNIWEQYLAIKGKGLGSHVMDSVKVKPTELQAIIVKMDTATGKIVNREKMTSLPSCSRR